MMGGRVDCFPENLQEIISKERLINQVKHKIGRLMRRF